MFDVICVGSANIDVFASTKFSHLKKLTNGMIAYPVGEKILLDHINFTSGVGGSNAAVVLSRRSHRVAFIGSLGADVSAEIIKKEFRKEKITDLSHTHHFPTGYSIVLDSVKHDRTIFVYKGANNHLDFSEIPESKLHAQWFYFATMMGKSYTSLEKLADYAERHHIKILFNASSYLVAKGKKFLKKILDKTTILVLNLEEAQTLVGKGSSENILQRLRLLGPQIVIITNGEEGVRVFDGQKTYFARPHTIKVVETTGAGDAFASGFLSGYIRKKDIPFAVQCGMHNAESVIQGHGAKTRLLTRREMDELMKKKPVHLSIRQFSVQS